MATMDFTIKIGSNSGGTIDLSSDPFQIRSYDIAAGDREDKEIDNLLELRVADGAVADNLDELRTLNDLLRDAHERNRKKDKRIDPVYVQWQEASGGTIWRSEIITAKADWLGESLEYGYWTNDTQFADLDFIRANYWEGPEAQLGLTNPNGTANTSGLNIYNVNDGNGSPPNAYYNYCDIAGTAIEGDLSGDTRLELTNNYAGTLGYVWIGQNYTNPSTFSHWLEAENATHSGTAVVGATYSGGTAILQAVADSTETEIFSWSLSSADLDAAAGGYFKCILRAYSLFNTSHRFKLKIQYNVTDLWETEYLTLDSNVLTLLRDIATFQLPPWLPGLTSLEGLDLVLSCYHTLGSSSNVRLDSIQITPVDGWRALRYIGYGTPQNSRIIDDGIDRRLYQDDGAGASKIGIYVSYGQPIRLKPATDQRLYFQMHSTQANTAERARSISAKLYYRPRRLTL